MAAIAEELRALVDLHLAWGEAALSMNPYVARSSYEAAMAVHEANKAKRADRDAAHKAVRRSHGMGINTGHPVLTVTVRTQPVIKY